MSDRTELSNPLSHLADTLRKHEGNRRISKEQS